MPLGGSNADDASSDLRNPQHQKQSSFTEPAMNILKITKADLDDHTPGPWFATKFSIPGHVFWVANHDGGKITEKGSEGKANAHLIAAAPALLELLRECYVALDHDERDADLSVRVKAAIAKAVQS